MKRAMLKAQTDKINADLVKLESVTDELYISSTLLFSIDTDVDWDEEIPVDQHDMTVLVDEMSKTFRLACEVAVRAKALIRDARSAQKLLERIEKGGEQC